MKGSKKKRKKREKICISTYLEKKSNIIGYVALFKWSFRVTLLSDGSSTWTNFLLPNVFPRQTAKIINFSAPLGSGNPNIENTFRYHPSCIEDDINYTEYKNRPQQSNPFPKSVIFSDILEKPNNKMEKLNISNSEYKKALLDYLGYLTSSLSPRFSLFHKDQQVDFSERLWSDSMVYSCTSYKEKCSNKTRRDDHCYFTSNHINK